MLQYRIINLRWHKNTACGREGLPVMQPSGLTRLGKTISEGKIYKKALSTAEQLLKNLL